MRVLIGGGTGFVGRHLQAVLKSKGHEVTILSRKPGPNTVTWHEIEDHGLPEDCSAVVNLAGVNLMDPMKRWNKEFQDELIESRVGTTKTLVSAINRASKPPDVFVGASAVGFYKPSPTAEYTEASDGGDFDFLSRLCHDWEAASEDVNTRRVTVRIGLVLGRDGGLIQNMYWPFYFNLGGKLGSGSQWFPWIHVGDVAGILSHAVENDHVTGVLNAVAPNPVTNGEFTQAFAKAMWRFAIFPVPGLVLNAVFGSERAKAMLEGQKVLPQRTMESGYDFVFPKIDEACKACTDMCHTLPQI